MSNQNLLIFANVNKNTIVHCVSSQCINLADTTLNLKNVLLNVEVNVIVHY